MPLFSPTCFFISMRCVIQWFLKTKYVDRIYRTELEIKKTTDTARLSLVYNYFIWSMIQRRSKIGFFVYPSIYGSSDCRFGVFKLFVAPMHNNSKWYSPKDILSTMRMIYSQAHFQVMTIWWVDVTSMRRHVMGAQRGNDRTLV